LLPIIADRLPFACHHFDHFQQTVQPSHDPMYRCGREGGATGCRRRYPPGAAICLALAERIWWPPLDPSRFGACVSDIFREIEEELRRDNLLKLWQRYWKHLAAVAAAALLVAGGVVAWREHQASERQAQAARYSSALALIRDGKEADAARAFGVLAQEGGGYGVLAGFEQAELLAKSGDRKGAVAAYDRLAASSGIDAEFRDLAVLLSVMHGLPEEDAKTAIERLSPLTASGNPWRTSALDLTAAAKLKSGDRDGARAIYKQLADDLTAPQALRARAAELAAALKS
jgi:hypothetical protein